MSQFPKARPTRKPKTPMPKRPRDWRTRTHVMANGGQVDWDDCPLCADCGFRADHAIHDLNVPTQAVEIDARTMGEAESR